MQTTYRAGQWYILVAPGALIALSPDAPEELVARLWDPERTTGDLAVVIDALTEQASGSFADMLPFAAVVLEGPNARVAVRGDVTVQVTGPDGPESFTGVNVTTWSERFVPHASRLAVTAGDAEPGAELPILGGIVRAASVNADIEPADIAAPDAVAANAEVDAGDEAESVDAEQPVPEPADEEPVDEEPADEEPADEEPVDEEPADEEPADEEPADEEPVSEQPVPEDTVVEEPVVEAPAVDEPSIDEPAAEEAEPVSEQPAPEDTVVEEPVVEAPATEQIPQVPDADDAVDGATLVPADAADSSDIDEFDQLFGETITSSPASVPPPAAPAPPAAPVSGDHDGATISVSEARALRKDVPSAAPDAPTAVLPVASGGTAGRLRVSTGQLVTLDRTVIIGRRPRSTRASGADLPHLIAVESPQQDISRSHLEVRPEGDTVVVVDLRTTNGSTLLRPSADPLRLHPGEPTIVVSGDVVDLGDGVTVAFEELP